MSPMASVVRIIALVFTVGGCTIVKVEGPARVTMVGLGAVRIEPVAAGGIVYRSRGIGLVPGLGGATLGYRSETAALLPATDDCRLILFEPHQRDAEALRDILKPVITDKQICINGGGTR
jgi:hypothetical protein